MSPTANTESRTALTELSSLPYPVVIGEGLEQSFATFLQRYAGKKIIVVCDRNVEAHARRYADAVSKKTPVLAFALGEKRKRLRTVEAVLDALIAAGADRSSVIVGVGGGVAGDLFGYAAASFMRGVPFVNIATSLVAMVDASIGGKTGVDLAAGKNLAGVFRDPIAVFAPVDTLATLSDRHLREGLGEVVKHAILDSVEAFEQLEEYSADPLRRWPWHDIVAESMRIKAAFVNDDAFEAGRRELLNLGHTFAHGIEYASDYTLSHGAAVAIGLRAAGLLAMRTERFSAAEHLRVVSLLALLRLPLFSDEVDVETILEGMTTDKKARSGSLRFVVPRAIGDVEFGVTVPTTAVRAVLRRIIAEPGANELR